MFEKVSRSKDYLKNDYQILVNDLVIIVIQQYFYQSLCIIQVTRPSYNAGGKKKRNLVRRMIVTSATSDTLTDVISQIIFARLLRIKTEQYRAKTFVAFQTSINDSTGFTLGQAITSAMFG